MTWEQMNQQFEMNKRLIESNLMMVSAFKEMKRRETTSAVISFLFFLSFLMLALYIFYWADINNIGTVFLSR